MSKNDQDTEQKIKEAARKLFQQKGFAATKTRDIAEAADINLALLNYYFRSKKKLYELIMVETMRSFFGGLLHVLNNENTSLKDKVSVIVKYYMDLLEENQNIASFIVNAVRENPEEYISQFGLFDKMKGSVFVSQFKDGLEKGEIPQINPFHFLLNLIGLIVFPFIVQPMITTVSKMPNESYILMLQERRKLIPLWVDSMLKVNKY